MTGPKPALRAYVMLAFVMLFWSGNSIVGRAFRDDIPPFTLALVRWSGAIVLLLPFALAHVVAEWALIRRNWPPILLLGLVGVATFNGLLYSGLHDTTAANALLLQALIPALVLLISAALFGDRASPGQIAGVVLSTIGVAVIVFRGEPMAIIRLHFGFGDGLILCACVAWAIYTACLRLRPPIHPMSLLFSTFLVGAVATIPLALTELRGVEAIDWRPSIFAAFAYVAIFPSVLAYFLYNSAVAQIGPGPAGQTISLMPLIGAVLATLLLSEPLHAYHGVGMAAILTGVLVTGYASSRTWRRA